MTLMAETHARGARGSSSSAESCPTRPASTSSATGDGEALYVGKASSIRKRVASPLLRQGRRARRLGGTSGLLAQVDSIESLVTQTEAEALLAEQSFIKRLRPRFNIRLRDDKSYPYVAVSLDEEYPAGLLHPRAPPLRPRLLRPLLHRPSGCARRSTCSASCSSTAPARAPSPGAAPASPASTTTSSAARRPASATSTERSTARNIDAIVDFLSGRYRADRRRPRGEDGRGLARPRTSSGRRSSATGSNAVRSLIERQRVAGGSIGSADLIGVAVEGTRRQRPGLPGPRRGARRAPELLPRTGAEDASRPRWPRASCSSTTRRRRRCRRWSSVGPELPRPRAELLAEALSERRDSPVEVRVAERGDKRRLRELAERNAQLALDQDRLRREHRRQQPRRVAVRAAGGAGAGARCRSGSRASTSPTWAATHTVASMVVFEGGAPKKSDYRQFKIRGENGDGDAATGPDDFASMQEVLERRLARYVEAGRPLAARRRARRQLRRAARPGRDRRRQGTARGRAAARWSRLRRARGRGGQPRQAARGGLRPGALRSDPARARAPRRCRLLQRVRDEAHRFAISFHRSRRDQAMTGSVLDGRPGGRSGAQARPAAALRLSRAAARRQPRGAGGGARGAR